MNIIGRGMKGIFLAALVAAGISGGAAVAAHWDYARVNPYAQSPYGQGPYGQGQRGRPGPGPVFDRGEPRRDSRYERREERRERLTDDERRSLHRDLDKANRELYGRRFQK